MPAQRLLPDDAARALVARYRDFAQTRLAPIALECERERRFPREVFAELGAMGGLGLVYPTEYGGGGVAFSVYLQALEELAGPFMGVGVATSVHSMSCWAVCEFGTPEQKQRLLRPMLSGELLGAYAMSEPECGSDVAAIQTRAVRDGDEWVIDGRKMWIGPAGKADYYLTFVRTGEGRSALSAFYVPGDAAGLSFPDPPFKLGMNATPVGPVVFDGVRVPAANLVGEEGRGMRYALAGLDRGRMAVAAIATGVAQAALDHALSYAARRQAFGQPIAEFQGLQFLLADMEAAVASGRATYLDAAARYERGEAFSRAASIAKLVCSDNAMRVCTDAIQVLGGAGFTNDHPVERYFREVKVTQIFEGTNQIQRLVIARDLLADLRAADPDTPTP